ncbi:MAG: ion channel [Pseudomonadota bacterium]|nr:ion channel [Pseudomonadota bacterium]
MGENAQLIHQLWIAAALIAASTFIHAIFVAVGGGVLRAGASRLWGPLRILRDAVALVLLALWLIVAHALEIGLWAGAFLRLDLFGDAATALYFAAVCYTTLGFGDVLAPPQWSLLPGAAAANGLLLFGLSAAFLVEASSKLRLAGK